jgi:hypothetical protein
MFVSVAGVATACSGAASTPAGLPSASGPSLAPSPVAAGTPEHDKRLARHETAGRRGHGRPATRLGRRVHAGREAAGDPAARQGFTAEHGPTFDDEVNLLRAGGNYGWDPSKGGTGASYDESVPMTDTGRFPDAIRPLWTTGTVTEAICGAAFLTGKQWGALDGNWPLSR